MKKNQNGITLIALVITIIVLLILAGVSIALLTSDGNILDNAGNAKADTAVGTAKEMAGIRAAGYLDDYYNYAYVTKDTSDKGTNGATSAGAYIKAQFEKATGEAGENLKESEGYTYAKSSGTITITSKTSGNKNVTGTIQDNGTIKWEEKS